MTSPSQAIPLCHRPFGAHDLVVFVCCLVLLLEESKLPKARALPAAFPAAFLAPCVGAECSGAQGPVKDPSAALSLDNEPLPLASTAPGRVHSEGWSEPQALCGPSIHLQKGGPPSLKLRALPKVQDTQVMMLWRVKSHVWRMPDFVG